MAALKYRGLTATSLASVAVCALAAAGCGTTRTSNTARTGTEQLLISDAIDSTIQQINFNVLEGETVYFDESRLLDVVDKGYLISSLRQHLLASGCILKEKREDATFVVEPRVGAVGTDNDDLLFGIPALQVPQVALAPALPAAIPEIPFAKRRDQRGVAKVAVFAYRRDTGEPVWQSGLVMSESEVKDIWVLGAGPFQRGTIHDRARMAGGRGKAGNKPATPRTRVASVQDEALFAAAPSRAVDVSHTKRSGVVQASAHTPIKAEPGAAGAPVLPPPRPISEAPKPDDPSATAG